MRCMRRSRMSAVKNTQAIFASSDGCTPSPPRPNHRRVPLIGALNSTADQHQRHQSEQRPHERVVAIGAVIDAHRHREQRQTEHGPHHLPRHEQVRLLIALEGDQRRGAVHHDDAGADQQQRRGKQHLVVFQRSRHELTPSLRTNPAPAPVTTENPPSARNIWLRSGIG